MAFGHFRVLHQAGTGILGPVFRSYDPRHDRLVAVKVFQLDITPEEVAKLAAALRQLVVSAPEGAGVPRLLDAGVEGTRAYLAMDYHAGETLDVVLRRSAPAALPDTLATLARIAHVIDRLALAGIHHGALHPRDVIVDPDGHAVTVTGFGVLQALAVAGVTVPLPRRAYLAPERATGMWDGRADVYSLGAIAHEWLTGKRPTTGGDQDGVFAGDLSPETRVQVRRVLRSALAEQPEARFVSASEFTSELQAIGGGEFLVEPAPTRLGRVPDSREATEPGMWGAAVEAEMPPALVDAGSASATPVSPDADVPAPSHHVAPDVLSHLDVSVLPPSGLPRGPLDAVDAGWTRRHELAGERRRRAWPWVAVAMVSIAVGSAGGYVLATWARSAATVAEAVPARTEGTDVPVVPTEPEVATTEPAPVAVDPAADALPAVVTKGRLVVRSQPTGAMVTVDGRIVGETPLVADGITFGEHEVLVAHPGHVPKARRVVLAEDARTRTLSFALESGFEAPPSHGSLHIESRPRAATAFVDGRLLGLTPLRVPELAPGRHRVTLELGGYDRMSSDVLVVAGEIHTVRVTMKARE